MGIYMTNFGKCANRESVSFLLFQNDANSFVVDTTCLAREFGYEFSLIGVMEKSVQVYDYFRLLF